MLRLTRYRYNNVPTDAGGRYFYVKDGDSVWTPGWLPVRKAKLDAYECRHGMGYSVIASKKDNLSVTQTSFVPLQSQLRSASGGAENEGTTAKDIKLFSFVEFCLWNAFDDMTNFQRNYSIGEVEVEGSAIYHKTEYRERRNHYAVFAVNAPLAGFDTDRETFMGLYNGFDHPDAVVCRGKAATASPTGGPPLVPTA